MTAEQLTFVAVLAAVVSALGTAMAAVFAYTASETSKRQLAESRETRHEQRQTAINGIAAELGRVVHLAVRWQQTNVIAEAIAETLDYAELDAPDWGTFVLVLGQLGQTGAMLAATGYGDLRDAAIYGRRLRYKAAEYRQAAAKKRAGQSAQADFETQVQQWRAEIQNQIVDPLLAKLDDAHEAIGEVLSASKQPDRRDRINVEGLTSKAALRWRSAQQ